MDPPRRLGSALGPQTTSHLRSKRTMEPSLSTAPASPSERTHETLAARPPLPPPPPPPPTTTTETVQTVTRPPLAAPPYSTLGHFSFAPATQQTIITTTTTTTVSLPPLLFKPPQDISTRDPKQYPLAFSPTPHALKKFCIDVGGRPVVYREATDAESSLNKYARKQSQLQDSNGRLQHETIFPETYDTPTRISDRLNATQRRSSRSIPQKRPTSPPSLAEAAELASLHRRRKKPRSLLSRSRSGLAHPQFIDHDHSNPSDTAATLDGPSPVTPDTEAGNSQLLQLGGAEEDASTAKGLASRLQGRQGNGPSSRAASNTSGRPTAPCADEHYLEQQGVTATPPVAESDLDPVNPSVYPHEPEYRRPLPPSLLNNSQQDASLPSPSLSPVTAAANLARSHQLLTSAPDATDDGNTSEVSGLDLEQTAAQPQDDETDNVSISPSAGLGLSTHGYGNSSSSMTVMDIPNMINAFDALPDEMQTYVLYQMLRRCPKKTLQTVASVINPALKCDPFDVLPVELGLQITKFLDVKSLCRSAQVSKKWRQLIDSDERAWKELLDRDGFNLPDGEIERAVREGWGWQNPGIDGFEEDLSVLKTSHSISRIEQDALSPIAGPSISSDDQGSATSQRVTRLKRKSTGGGSSHKRQKRKAASKRADEPPPFWLKDLEQAQGPIAYASAAAKAVPNPNVGLSTLVNLHLFKSIYQRHYLVAKSWMDPNSQPQHLAFRAHHRHVVTCLLFDSDKILTGSDDTNINVYDTKTGVLRKRLEGHEGGVWALQYEGDTLVSGSTDRSVRVWDIPSGKCLQTFQGHTSTVRCLVILKPAKIGVESDGTPIMMPKEPLIITGSRDSSLRVWKLPKPGDVQIHQAGPPVNDSDNPYYLRVLQGHSNSVRAIAAHGDTLVSGSYDFTVRVWKISTGELLHRLASHTQKVYSVVLDHERGRCISGSMDNLVKVWSLETGACLFNLEGHTSLVGLLDLSHERLVSAAADSTLRIWHPETGHCLSTLSAHTGAITCFQHDDQKVISGSDRTLKMWNIETGECVRDLLSNLSGVWQVRFDDRRCVAAVQRNNLTYIEVLDFGAVRDGVGEVNRGRRIVVDHKGREIEDLESIPEVNGLATG